MPLIIDSQTQINYGNRVIDIDKVLGFHDENNISQKDRKNAPRHILQMFNELPLDELVLFDILAAPIWIVRDPAYGDLVFQGNGITSS